MGPSLESISKDLTCWAPQWAEIMKSIWAWHSVKMVSISAVGQMMARSDVSSGTPPTQAYAESHIYLPEDGVFYVYHTQRWLDGPFDYSGEDIGVEIFVNWEERDEYSVTFPLWFDRNIAAVKQTICEYNTDIDTPQGGQFCPPVKTQLSGIGINASVVASVGFTLTAQCSESNVNMKAEIHVFESSDGLKQKG